MAKEFYTERDIEDMWKRGVMSLQMDENVVLTELAYEKAQKLGMQLLRRFRTKPGGNQNNRTAGCTRTALPLPIQHTCRGSFDAYVRWGFRSAGPDTRGGSRPHGNAGRSATVG